MIVTDRTTSQKVLAPLDRTPVIPCVGMNYVAHIIETKNEIPPSPVVFVKPADALAGPHDDITIPSHALLMDYEVELCLIIAKDCKDVTAAEAKEYIFGYTGGNDLSSRHWQRPPHSGGQYCYGKGFDGFAPIGPTILNAHAPGVDPSQIDLTLWVNGDQRQQTSTGDMVFDVFKIVEFLSKGYTLRKGTVIMTGTPSGIASRRVPPPWLQKGDIVKMTTSKIGTIENKLVGF